MGDFYIRTTCRLCDHGQLDKVLELAPTPPANEFAHPASDGVQEVFPLYLARCAACGHVQLPVVVDPERLFRNYLYVSGTAPSFVEHFARYAEDCAERFDLKAGALVVEIGSNDGTMLRQFRRLGLAVHGVDPAEAIALRANEAGIPTTCAFFTRGVAEEIRHQRGRASLVVANNVFAHADDLHEIVLGVRELLEPRNGRFVFEVQYLGDLVDKTLFDMIYHEHLSYHSLGPLIMFFYRLGMSVLDVERVSTHGGSIRVTVGPWRGMQLSRAARDLEQEEVLTLGAGSFLDLRKRIDDAGAALRAFLNEERTQRREVAGYGAPAKMTTLCHQFGITREDIAYVVDDSPWKQGLLSPGTFIPVVAPFSRQHAPESFVIFAWNFAEAIAKKLRASGFRGKIVTPLPTFKELP